MIRAWLDRRNALVCRDAVAVMSDYLDRRLDDRARARLERHRLDCPHCTEHLAQLRVTIDLVGHADPDQLSDEALDDLVALYRRWQAD